MCLLIVRPCPPALLNQPAVRTSARLNSLVTGRRLSSQWRGCLSGAARSPALEEPLGRPVLPLLRPVPLWSVQASSVAFLACSSALL